MAQSVSTDCQTRYTTDAKTKKRGMVLAIPAVLTIVLSAAGFLVGFPWGFLSFVSGTISVIFLGYVLKDISYITYDENNCCPEYIE